MCWKIDKEIFDKNPNCYHKIAEEDTEVYKLGYGIDNEFISYFYHDFLYKANFFTKEIKLINKYNINLTEISVDEGYHSYSGECAYLNANTYDLKGFKIESCLETYGRDRIESMCLIEEFFDKTVAMAFLSTLTWDSNKAIGKFIIPKGSEYYKNENNEIVSSQLIWTGKLKYLVDINIESFTRIKLKDLKYVLENRKA